MKPDSTDRRRLLARAATLGCLATAPWAWAQALPGGWPKEPIKVIVPGAAGSGTDIMARALMEPVAKRFGATIVIDNRPGANGMLGTELAARAPKDGHTLLFTYAAAQVVNQSLYAKANYDGARDFAAIAQVGGGGSFLVVPANHPANSLQELIAWVRAQPADAVAYGSWGIGSGGHLSMAALEQKAGLKMRHIPYKGVPQALNDLMAGHIQVTFAAVAVAMPLIQGGKLKTLAYSAPTRSSQFPEVKTMSEQGISFELTAWYGLFAPAGTPKAIVDALNAEVVRQLNAPENAQKWVALGLAERPNKTPEQFAETVRNDIRDWGAVVRAAKLTVE